MFIDQNNKCYVCSKESGDTKGTILHVDHDHSSNIVRKLLCSACNTIAARIENDPDLTARIIMYLKEHNSSALARLEFLLREKSLRNGTN